PYGERLRELLRCRCAAARTGREESQHDASALERAPGEHGRRELAVDEQDLVARTPVDSPREHVEAITRAIAEDHVVLARANELGERCAQPAWHLNECCIHEPVGR